MTGMGVRSACTRLLVVGLARDLTREWRRGLGVGTIEELRLMTQRQGPWEDLVTGFGKHWNPKGTVGRQLL